jgi:hypothetical protein
MEKDGTYFKVFVRSGGLTKKFSDELEATNYYNKLHEEGKQVVIEKFLIRNGVSN